MSNNNITNLDSIVDLVYTPIEKFYDDNIKPNIWGIVGTLIIALALGGIVLWMYQMDQDFIRKYVQTSVAITIGITLILKLWCELLPNTPPFNSYCSS